MSWEGLRTSFPGRVTPGSTVSLDAHVEAPPEPGDYRLMWDVEQEHRLWFSTEPDAPLYVTRAAVSGPAIGPQRPMYAMTLPRNAVRPGRLVLWGAAADLFATRPVLGIGPDNYRLRYGEYAGLANFDRRVHSNNMYLEMLVGGGIVGGLAFGWLCWSVAMQLFRSVRNSDDPAIYTAVAALSAATVAIFLHGLVDSFLSFTGTYVLIALTLGLTTASLALNSTHAHRI